MIILGIDHNRHDSAACLLIDGKVVAMAEEERFLRKKHAGDIPVNATNFCLRYAGISVKDIDHLAFFYNPYLMIRKRIWQFVKYFPTSIHLLRRRAEAKTRIERMGMFFSEKRLLKRVLFNNNPDCRWKFHYIEHHFAHASSTFTLSPFEEAAILSIDGAGEWATTWLGYGNGHKVYRIREVEFPHSIGLLYSAITEFLGFKPWSGEGKVMGLASYGEPTYYPIFREIVRKTENGGFKMDMSYFNYHTHGWSYWVSDKFLRTFGPKRIPESEITKRDMDIAASLQKITEEIMQHCVDYLYRVTKMKNLCLAGGVALNCVANGKVFRDSNFEHIFIQPVAGDAGTSLGAALFLYHNILDQPRVDRMINCYWGPEYSDKEIEEAIKKSGLTYSKIENIAKKTAELLAEGKIIGWFQGRMECGPRALGNRSILADPRDPNMKDILNAKVKHRESFRPFAPSSTLDGAEKYFKDLYPSPYMILSFDVIEDKKQVIPAVTHVDGTARVQTVTEEENPLYYRLIKEFEKITGVPVILNTSFNVRGEPIVCSPEDAIKCFLGTQMDYLVLGNYLIDKNEVKKP